MEANRLVTAKFRITEKERAAFGEAAKSVGLSLSSWIRMTLHTAAQPQIAALSRKRVKS